MKLLYKTWAVYFLITLVVAITLVGLINYTVDPLWCFAHANRFNLKQLAFDERQQKANYLMSHVNDYDAIIIGSSRLTTMNQYEVKGFKAFNSAVSGMLPNEFSQYIDFIKRHNSKKIKLIIVGLDFFSSNLNFNGFGGKPLGECFDCAESDWCKIKGLLTYDELHYSVENAEFNFKSSATKPYYTRNNIVKIPNIQGSIRDANINRDIFTFHTKLYGPAYHYRDFKKTYADLLEKNKGTRFIVFVTPESSQLWNLLLKENLLNYYLRWINDIVYEFGAVYIFMGKNDITMDKNNFIDGHHVYPHAGKQILIKILNLPGAEQIHAGCLVDKNNIKSYINKMHQEYNM